MAKRKPPVTLPSKIEAVGAAILAMPPAVRPHATVTMVDLPGVRVYEVTVAIGETRIVRGSIRWHRRGQP